MSMASIRAHGWQGRTDAKILWRRAGLAGFAFFFVKGLVWLLAPLAWYVIR